MSPWEALLVEYFPVLHQARIVYVYIISLKRHYPKSSIIGKSILQRLSHFVSQRLFFLPFLILLRHLGVVTTTEASVLAVLYSLILGFFLYRTMNLKSFIECLSKFFSLWFYPAPPSSRQGV